MRETEWRQWHRLGWSDGGAEQFCGWPLLGQFSDSDVAQAALGWGLSVDVLEVVEQPLVCCAGQTKAVKMTAYKFSIAHANNFSLLFSALVGFSSGGIRIGGVKALQTLRW